MVHTKMESELARENILSTLAKLYKDNGLEIHIAKEKYNIRMAISMKERYLRGLNLG